MIKQLRFLLVLALLSVIGQASAQTIVTFTAGTDNGENTGNGQADQISKDGVTIYCSDALSMLTTRVPDPASTDSTRILQRRYRRQ